MKITAESFVYDLSAVTHETLVNPTWACVAGGYVRDAILDKPWTDVDLFFGMKEKYLDKNGRHTWYLRVGKSSLKYKPVLLPAPHKEDSITHWYLLMVPSSEYNDSGFMSFTCPRVPALNVILRRIHDNAEPTARDMVKKFPCNMAACWVEAGKLYAFPGFYKGMEDSVLYFSSLVPDKYRVKICEKFPTWPSGTCDTKDFEYYMATERYSQ